jgi:hypothetical protein
LLGEMIIGLKLDDAGDNSRLGDHPNSGATGDQIRKEFGYRIAYRRYDTEARYYCAVPHSAPVAPSRRR